MLWQVFLLFEGLETSVLPFPKGEFDVTHAERLAATVVEPFQIPRGFLYALGLSSHWEFPGSRAAVRDESGIDIASVLSFVHISYCCYFVFYRGVRVCRYRYGRLLEETFHAQGCQYGERR